MLTPCEQLLESLHTRAALDNIDVFYTRLKASDALCAEYQDAHYIAIDTFVSLHAEREAEVLAHELAHMDVGIPPSHASRSDRQTYEARACRRAAEMLISWEAFQEALEDPWNDSDAALAEHFGVSVDTLRWAVRGFQHRGLMDW